LEVSRSFLGFNLLLEALFELSLNISSNPKASSTSSTYNWADETLAKDYEQPKPYAADSTDSLNFAKNDREMAEIEAGKRKGRMNILLFEKAWNNSQRCDSSVGMS
jgi:hypothetical protein